MSIRRAKFNRFIFRLLFFLIGYVAPLTFIFGYELYKKEQKITLTTVGLAVVLIVLMLIWRFKRKLINWINTWEYSILKYILLGISKVYIWIIVFVVTFLIHKAYDKPITPEQIKQAEQIVVSFYVVSVAQCVAYLLIAPIESYFDYKVKRLIRKKERKEDYKEAIKELEAE
jgi:chromate transport protein ChrA